MWHKRSRHNWRGQYREYNVAHPLHTSWLAPLSSPMAHVHLWTRFLWSLVGQIASSWCIYIYWYQVYCIWFSLEASSLFTGTVTTCNYNSGLWTFTFTEAKEVSMGGRDLQSWSCCVLGMGFVLEDPEHEWKTQDVLASRPAMRWKWYNWLSRLIETFRSCSVTVASDPEWWGRAPTQKRKLMKSESRSSDQCCWISYSVAATFAHKFWVFKVLSCFPQPCT